MRVLAVDWSGDARAPARRIRVAEAAPGGSGSPGRSTGPESGPSSLLGVRGGLDRDGVVDLVLDVAAEGPVVVGLDFSFALPAWFAHEHGCVGIDDLWALVTREGEEWMRREAPPFWGRSTPRPPEHPDRPGWRRTETAARAAGLAPKSTFQIGGAGAVGTGSLRGMPHLARLRAAGVAVWPFDAAGAATVLEVYPSMFTGGARRTEATRRAFLAGDPRVSTGLLDDAVATEDAFDAALTALAMAEHVVALRTLPAAAPDTPEAIEGALWAPGQRTVSSSASTSPI